MKRFFLSLGKAACYFFTYFNVQVFVSFLVAVPVMMVNIIPLAMGLSRSGDMSGYLQDVTEMILSLMGKITVPIQILSSVLTLLVIWLFLRILRRNVFAEMGMKRKVRIMPLIPLALAAIAMQGLIESAFSLLPVPTSMLDNYIQSSSLLGETNVWQVIAVVLCAPFLEEIVFRGCMQTKMAEGMPTIIAILFQGILFGLMHCSPLWIAYAMPFGFVLGWVYASYKSLWASILIHLVFNGASYGWMYLGDISQEGLVWILIASAVALVGVFAYIAIAKHRDPDFALVKRDTVEA